jgi:hypothetical protein
VLAGCLAPAPAAWAQAFGLGVKLPVQLQDPSLQELYNNVEVEGTWRIGNLLQLEANLLIPVAPLFVSLNATLTLLELAYDESQRALGFFVGAGVIYISVGPQKIVGFQGLAGVEWCLPGWPISLVFESGAKFFDLFIATYSGLFVSLGVRLHF